MVSQIFRIMLENIHDLFLILYKIIHDNLYSSISFNIIIGNADHEGGKYNKKNVTV